jgi:hypothetical protein
MLQEVVNSVKQGTIYTKEIACFLLRFSKFSKAWSSSPQCSPKEIWFQLQLPPRQRQQLHLPKVQMTLALHHSVAQDLTVVSAVALALIQAAAVLALDLAAAQFLTVSQLTITEIALLALVATF